MKLEHKTGTLYMIPTLLGESDWALVLPATVQKVIAENNHFVVENEKSARHHRREGDKFELFDKQKVSDSRDLCVYLGCVSQLFE